jgi:magnesium transporter
MTCGQNWPSNGGSTAGLWATGAHDTRSAGRSPAVRILAQSGEGTQLVREIPPNALKSAIAAGEIVWIDIVRPEESAASLLRQSLDLEPLTIEDCLVTARMPKFDRLPDEGAYVAAFEVQLDRVSEPRLRAMSVALVVGPTYLVTLRRDAAPEMTARLEAALGPERELPKRSGPVLAHVALDALVDRHLPVMLEAAEVAEDLEDALDPRAERRGLTALERLIVLRRDLLAFRRLAVAQQEVLRRVGRAFPQVRSDLADVADTQREAIDTAAATCDYIDGAIEAYRVRRDAQTEDGIRRLSVIAGILWPTSLLIALWGINFSTIPGTETPWGWPIFVSIQVVLILSGIWYFRCRGML